MRDFPWSLKLTRGGKCCLFGERTIPARLTKTQMQLTRTLPTDRHGHVYYGPATYAEAYAIIVHEDYSPSLMADTLARAGYIRIAARIRKSFATN